MLWRGRSVTWGAAVRKQEAFENVGHIRHCEPPHAHSRGVAVVARRLCIDVHDNDDDDNNNDYHNA